MSFERVHFRMIQMPCCGQMLCWVNPRTPNYCPECGKFVYAELRSGTHFRFVSDDAILEVPGAN